jgi:hypothetical protein
MHVAKRCGGEFGEGRLGAAGDDRVGVTVLDHPQRQADAVGAAGARGPDLEGLAAKAVLHRDRSRGGVGHVLRHAQWRDLTGAALAHHLKLSLDRPLTTDPGGDHAPDPVGVIGLTDAAGQPGLGQRLARGDERELGEAIKAPSLLHRQVRTRIEVGAAPEAVDDADHSGGPALVQPPGTDPERGDGTETGDDDLASVRGSGHPGTPSRRARR